MIMALRNGANYHYCAHDKSTLLGNLIQMYHPLTAQGIIRHWLMILKSHGVDTGQYLLCEVELYMAHRGESREQGNIRRRRIELFGQRDDTVSVTWEGYFPGPCQEVLQEFVSFGDDRCFSSSLIYSVIRERHWPDFWPYSWNSIANCERRRPLESKRSKLKRRRRLVDESETMKVPGAWVH